MLTFEEKEHVYRWNGNVVKSVTELLHEYIKVRINGFEYYVSTKKIDKKKCSTAIPAYLFEAAADHGTAVHKMFYWIISGRGLIEDTLDPDLINPLRQIKAFRDKYQPETIIMEKPLYYPKDNFAGTPDWFGILKGMYRRVLLDVKTGGYELVAEQLSAYEKMIREETKYRGMIDYYVLFIPKDGGDYQLIPIPQGGAWKRFQARMIINN